MGSLEPMRITTVQPDMPLLQHVADLPTQPASSSGNAARTARFRAFGGAQHGPCLSREGEAEVVEGRHASNCRRQAE